MNISTQQMKAAQSIVAFICFFLNFSFGQTLELEKTNQYSFLAGQHTFNWFIPNFKVRFDSKSNVFFNLNYLTPGTSNGIAFGSIIDNQISLFDTTDVVGFPEQLINIFVDDIDNRHYSVASPFGGRVSKADKEGNILWDCFSSNDKPFNPVFHILSSDNHPIILWDKLIQDTTQRTLVKLDNETGAILWESENVFDITGDMTGRILKEVDGHFQLFQNNNNFLNITFFDQNGIVTQSNSKELNGNSPRYIINVDDFGNTYLGMDGWGYQCPKLNTLGDTIWFYNRPSPFGNEVTNRTLDILFDQSGSVYLSGPYRFIADSTSSMLLTKLDAEGEMLWETSTHHLNEAVTIFPSKTFINNDTIWTAFNLSFGPGDFRGGVMAFDLEGDILLYKEIEEFSPIGLSGWMDFHEDEIVILGSSSAEIDTDSIYQHIIRYKVSTITNVSTPEVQTVKIIPYPNPSSDWLSFKNLNAAELDFIKISDMQGRVVSFLEKDDIEDSININYLAAGTYIFNYGVDGKQYAAKIVKQ